MNENRRNNDILIGELLAESKASKSQRALLFEETKDIKEMIADLTVTVQTNITHNNSRLEEVEEDLASHGKAISSLKTFKNRMLIGIAAIGGTGGIAGALTTNLANKLGLN